MQYVEHCDIRTRQEGNMGNGKKELKEKRPPVWVAIKISSFIESKGELMSLILFLADTVSVCYVIHA